MWIELPRCLHQKDLSTSVKGCFLHLSLKKNCHRIILPLQRQGQIRLFHRLVCFLKIFEGTLYAAHPPKTRLSPPLSHVHGPGIEAESLLLRFTDLRSNRTCLGPQQAACLHLWAKIGWHREIVVFFLTWRISIWLGLRINILKSDDPSVDHVHCASSAASL